MTDYFTRVMIRNWMDIIATAPSWEGGNYQTNPTSGLLPALTQLQALLYTPQWFAANVKTADEYRLWKKTWHDIWVSYAPQDARDVYYTFQADANFSVGDTAGFKGETRAALRAIKAAVLVIGARDDLLLNREINILAKNEVPKAVYLEIETAFGHLVCCGADPEATKTIDREIARFLSKLR